MSRDDSIALDVARAAHLVLEFKQGMDKTAFLDDIKTQSAILHQLMVMGEAVKRLSTEYRNHHPVIPWKLIAGMRDRLIHGYDIVDLEEVWNTTDSDIPEILTSLQPLLVRFQINISMISPVFTRLRFHQVCISI